MLFSTNRIAPRRLLLRPGAAVLASRLLPVVQHGVSVDSNAVSAFNDLLPTPVAQLRYYCGGRRCGEIRIAGHAGSQGRHKSTIVRPIAAAAVVGPGVVSCSSSFRFSATGKGADTKQHSTGTASETKSDAGVSGSTDGKKPKTSSAPLQQERGNKGAPANKAGGNKGDAAAAVKGVKGDVTAKGAPASATTPSESSTPTNNANKENNKVDTSSANKQQAGVASTVVQDGATWAATTASSAATSTTASSSISSAEQTSQAGVVEKVTHFIATKVKEATTGSTATKPIVHEGHHRSKSSNVGAGGESGGDAGKHPVQQPPADAAAANVVATQGSAAAAVSSDKVQAGTGSAPQQRQETTPAAATGKQKESPQPGSKRPADSNVSDKGTSKTTEATPASAAGPRADSQGGGSAATISTTSQSLKSDAKTGGGVESSPAAGDGAKQAEQRKGPTTEAAAAGEKGAAASAEEVGVVEKVTHFIATKVKEATTGSTATKPIIHEGHHRSKSSNVGAGGESGGDAGKHPVQQPPADAAGSKTTTATTPSPTATSAPSADVKTSSPAVDAAGGGNGTRKVHADGRASTVGGKPTPTPTSTAKASASTSTSTASTGKKPASKAKGNSKRGGGKHTGGGATSKGSAKKSAAVHQHPSNAASKHLNEASIGRGGPRSTTMGNTGVTVGGTRACLGATGSPLAHQRGSTVAAAAAVNGAAAQSSSKGSSSKLSSATSQQRTSNTTAMGTVGGAAAAAATAQATASAGVNARTADGRQQAGRQQGGASSSNSTGSTEGAPTGNGSSNTSRNAPAAGAETVNTTETTLARHDELLDDSDEPDDGELEPDAMPRYPQVSVDGILRFADYAGTALFCVSGTIVAAHSGMDLLGCIVVGSITGLGGGTIRDMIVGSFPVSWLIELEYLYMCLLLTALCFLVFFYKKEENLPDMQRVVFWADALGIGAFCCIGTIAGLQRGHGYVACVVLATVTSTGGGVIRDVLCDRPVRILHSYCEIYASAAISGSIAYLLARNVFHLSLAGRILSGWTTAVVLRYLGDKYDLRLPTITTDYTEAAYAGKSVAVVQTVTTGIIDAIRHQAFDGVGVEEGGEDVVSVAPINEDQSSAVSGGQEGGGPSAAAKPSAKEHHIPFSTAAAMAMANEIQTAADTEAAKRKLKVNRAVRAAVLGPAALPAAVSTAVEVVDAHGNKHLISSEEAAHLVDGVEGEDENAGAEEKRPLFGGLFSKKKRKRIMPEEPEEKIQAAMAIQVRLLALHEKAQQQEQQQQQKVQKQGGDEAATKSTGTGSSASTRVTTTARKHQHHSPGTRGDEIAGRTALQREEEAIVAAIVNGAVSLGGGRIDTTPRREPENYLPDRKRHIYVDTGSGAVSTDVAADEQSAPFNNNTTPTFGNNDEILNMVGDDQGPFDPFTLPLPATPTMIKVADMHQVVEEEQEADDDDEGPPHRIRKRDRLRWFLEKQQEAAVDEARSFLGNGLSKMIERQKKLWEVVAPSDATFTSVENENDDEDEGYNGRSAS